MSWVAVAVVGTGTALNMYGQYQESKNRSESLLRQAHYDDMRANELLERNEINNELLREKGNRAMGAAVARSAASQDTLGSLEAIARDINRQVELEERDAKFEANMIRLGAGESRKEAEDEKDALPLRLAGTALSGAGSAYMAGK